MKNNKKNLKLLSEIKYVYINGDIRFPAIAVPLKYTKKVALKLAKKFYLEFQKNKEIYKKDYFNRFPSHNKIIKNFLTSYELFYQIEKIKYYRCWIINLTDDARRFMHDKNRSKKATYKIQLKRYKAMDRLIELYWRKHENKRKI